MFKTRNSIGSARRRRIRHAFMNDGSIKRTKKFKNELVCSQKSILSHLKTETKICTIDNTTNFNNFFVAENCRWCISRRSVASRRLIHTTCSQRSTRSCSHSTVCWTTRTARSKPIQVSTHRFLSGCVRTISFLPNIAGRWHFETFSKTLDSLTAIFLLIPTQN